MISKKEYAQDMGLGFYGRSKEGGYIPLLVKNFEIITTTEGLVIVVPLGIHFAHEMRDYMVNSVPPKTAGLRWGLTVNLVPNRLSYIKDNKLN